MSANFFKGIADFFRNLFPSKTPAPKPIEEAPQEQPEPSKPNVSGMTALAEELLAYPCEFPNLKPIVLAQWLLESGRGTSQLSIIHSNYAGLKWRSEMVGFAIPVVYDAHDGTESYCHFASPKDFIKGYWRFLERSPYDGWKSVASDAKEFLRFIVHAGYCPDNGYVDKVISLIPEATKLLESVRDPATRNNTDSKPDDLGIELETYEKNKKELFYPKAIRYPNNMRTKGTYKNHYPVGAVVHFTSGRSRKSPEGGKRNQPSHLKQGAQMVNTTIDEGNYAYFVIDRDGNVHQAFSLDRWGQHAGESAWAGLSGTVSDELVGIEIECAGQVEPNGDGNYRAWFTVTSKGDALFTPDEVRVSVDNDNIQKGAYHKYSEAQEKALVELLLWLKANNESVFQFKFVAGHDEVAGKKGIGYNRKNDPGGSLSMTMTEFRSLLETEYNKRYNK